MSKQSPAPRVPRRPLLRRGMMVVGTMLVLLGLMSIVLVGLLSSGTGGTSSSGMMSAADNGLFSASGIGQRVVAENLAEAGAEDTLLWLSAQSAAPLNTSAFAPSDPNFGLPLWSATTQAGTPPRAVVNYPDAKHTFSVTVYPNSGNADSSQKGYLIESIGNDAGFKQILHVYVALTCFSHYCWFESNGGPGTWSSNLQQMDGPTHYNNMWGSYYLNWRDGTAPLFTYQGPDAFTTGFSFGWQHNGTVVSGPPAGNDTAGWNSLSTYGPTSIRQNQNTVPFPSSAAAKAVQKTAALGTLSSPPTSAVGATACPGGGLYIHGDVQQMTLSTDAFNSEIQVMDLYQIDPSSGARDYTKITFGGGGPASIQTGTYTPSGTITLNPASSWPASVPGAMNGVIYCDGNIGSTTYPEGGLKGVVADNNIYCGTNYHTNALTIATDPTKSVVVDGNILYNTRRQIQQNANGQYEFHDCYGNVVTNSSSTTPANCVPIYVPESSDTGNFKTWAGELGLVTDNIVYAANNYNATGSSSTGQNTSLELDCDLFQYGSNGESAYSWQVPGLALYFMGSDVHQNGTFGWSGPVYGDHGWDTRLAANPTPFYPMTVNRYTRVSWQRVASCVQGTP